MELLSKSQAQSLVHEVSQEMLNAVDKQLRLKWQEQTPNQRQWGTTIDAPKGMSLADMQAVQDKYQALGWEVKYTYQDQRENSSWFTFK